MTIFALYSEDAWISEFIFDEEIFTFSITDGEKFFDNAFAKSLSLYTQDYAPVTPTFVPDLYLATYTPTTAYLDAGFESFW